MPDPVQVRSMFGRIAPTYDLLNRCLTLGTDQRWRRRLVDRSVACGGEASALAADVCCGSGDVSILLSHAGQRVVGVDFTDPLLLRAERKAARMDGDRPSFVRGDALRMPAPGGRFGRVTIAFGLRNLADRRAGLDEFLRVLEPGGWLLVLELSMPRGFLGSLYRVYFTRLLPAIGRLVSRDSGAYGYLRDTVLGWPAPEALAEEIDAAGFDEVGFERMSLGIVALHWGRKPLHPAGGSAPGPAAP